MRRYTGYADKALAGEVLTAEEAREVLATPAGEILDLLQAAFTVRHRYWGRRVQIHVLLNARSGLCPEDCFYCSQSKVSEASIEKYPLLSRERIVEAALRAKEARARRFCIVASGRGPTDREVREIAEAVREIKSRIEIGICCSLGLMSREQAAVLGEAGVERINHNLNTSRRHYPTICTTHTYDDRVATVQNVGAAGVSPCSGLIVGMGETGDDLYEVACTLRDLHPGSVPVNFLNPIPGTPLEGRSLNDPLYALKVLCLFRFLLPEKDIRVAGGREVTFRSLQPLVLYPGNSIFVNGYLTTPGLGAAETHRMVTDMGFEIEEAEADPIRPRSGEEAGVSSGGQQRAV